MDGRLGGSAASGDPMLVFLEAMPDGMVVSDTDGRIVLVNGTVEKLSGYTADELVGKPVEILVPERYRRKHLTHRGGYYESGLPPRAMGTDLEIFLQRKDGHDVPVDISLSTIQVGGRTLVISAIRDATDRKRAEAAIRESERRWRTLLENVRLLVVGLDPDRRVSYANPFLRQVTGYTEEELLGEDWFKLIHPEDLSGKVQDVFNLILSNESAAHYVTAIRTKSGRQRVIAWYNAVLRSPDGVSEGTLSIGEDITDRKRAEDRLEAVNAVTRSILENQHVDEVLRIIAERSRALVDAAIATIVMPEPGDDTLVIRVADGAHADDLEGMRFSASESGSGEVMRSRMTMILADATGDLRLAQPAISAGQIGPAMIAPLAIPDRVFGTLLVGRPQGAPSFTDEDRSVIELFASQAAIALEHARYQEDLHRLAVLDDRERIGRELHDGAIQTLFATGMKLQSALSAGATDAASRVEQAVADIDRVIGELRGYIFGLRPTRSGARATADTLRTIAEELQERSGVVTVVDIDPAAAQALDPADEAIQLVREALSNVSRHSKATTCRLSLQRVGGNIVLEIDDDGMGFVVEERLGTGHGLSNLQERAAALGAALEIGSEPGRGTTVRVTIPA